MKAYFIRALWGEYTQIFKDRRFAAIGWLDKIPAEPHSRDYFIQEHRRLFPDNGDARTYQNAGQIFRFWNHIKEGDIVVSTYRDGRLIVGKATGNPYFEKDDFTFYERIPVQWNDQTVNRYQLSIGLQNTLKSSLTVFSISQVEEIAQAAGFDVPESKKKDTIPFDQAKLTENIRKKILTLDAAEFELLVSKLLQTLGFEATQETGHVGDRGIDYEGILKVNGVASVKLQVQVKRYESNKINDTDIRNFRGSLKRDFQGTFITLSNFAPKAIEGANNPAMETINLINGKQFVDLFILQYDDVMKLLFDDENEVLIEKLQFKKTLIPL
ncbi:restriction endonuclease [bacterium SCSIO 12741]|nr:restriction endonuclease [bacterium SCSIO 12741]